jgi:HSP20 family protein
MLGRKTGSGRRSSAEPAGALRFLSPGNTIMAFGGVMPMSVVRWEPSSEMADLRRTVRRLFEDLRPDACGPSSFPVDLYETPEEIVVRCELPGIRVEDVQVQLQGGRLTIRASRRESIPEGARPIQTETVAGEFVRAFSLGVPVVADDVAADYENGVLTVHLPKADEARAKTIAVRAS